MNELTVLTQEQLTTKDNMVIQIYVDNMYKNTISGIDIIEAYLSTLKNANTIRAYRKSITDFFVFTYGEITLTSSMLVIDPVKAMAYSNYCKQLLDEDKIKSSTFNTKIKGIKQFYDWLIGQTTLNTKNIKLFNINPFTTVKQIAENDAEGSEPLTPNEIRIMLETPFGESEHIQTRNVLLLEIAISTGIRNSALLGIKREDIKYVNGNWIIDTIDKENKKALKPINNYAKELLEWYDIDLKLRGLNNNGTVFNIHPHSANRIIKEWAKSVNIDKKITFHSLRTTTAVQIYHMSNDNLGKAQLALNHSHSATTCKYIVKEDKINGDTENIVEIIKDADNKFNDYIDGLDKNELISILKELDDNTKFQILNQKHEH
jgi:site-specific recombinase XerD